MKAKELRVKSAQDLLSDLSALQVDLLKLKMRKGDAVAEGKELGTHKFRLLRKDIARVKTLLKELDRD